MAHLATLSALASAFGWLHRRSLGWLVETLGHADHRFNVAVLSLTVVFVARRGLRLEPPRARSVPLVVFAVGSLGAVVSRAVLDIDLFAAAAVLLAAFGLLGLCLAPDRWRAAWPVAALVVLALPFGTQLDTWLGFPARIWTARGVAAVLAAVGVPVGGAETVVLVDSGLAHVDLPCSGVRGLWAGGLLFLAVTGLERARLGLRWLLAGLAVCATLLATNFVRVLVLVSLASVAGRPRLADLLHLPLGIVGFVAAGLLALRLLRRPAAPAEAPPSGSPAPLLLPALAAACLCVAAIEPPPQPPAERAVPRFALPSGLLGTPLPLAPAESGLFGRHALTLEKRRFQSGDLSGALLVVFARDWRAHHPPEVCLAAAGARIDGVAEVHAPFALRWLSLGAERRAAYWYQSPAGTSAGLLARTWADLVGREHRWAMVTVVYDAPLRPADAADLHTRLAAAVRAAWSRS